MAYHHDIQHIAQVNKYVLDNGTGGTGNTFDWQTIPPTLRHKALLAGGLNSDNCLDALNTGCLGLDFNSGWNLQQVSKIHNVYRKSLHNYNKANFHKISDKDNITMRKLNPYFGEFGGQYVPEILIPALDQLEQAFIDAQNDPSFQQEFQDLLKIMQVDQRH